jgi:hypothetical protein
MCLLDGILRIVEILNFFKMEHVFNVVLMERGIVFLYGILI